ncbi:hypothetical protein WR25_06003 [Diploscapter pachys]|uniref:Nematode cuticle collagen N-terminal domain-containing protein n=1 Tax=Diploscapter pachys TaxID=2018661 RepID=A0A2A2LQW6_9BILA|nr:hypothetical protein WR25_06003 [Diploscapter pachys]
MIKMGSGSQKDRVHRQAVQDWAKSASASAYDNSGVSTSMPTLISDEELNTMGLVMPENVMMSTGCMPGIDGFDGIDGVDGMDGIDAESLPPQTYEEQIVGKSEDDKDKKNCYICPADHQESGTPGMPGEMGPQGAPGEDGRIGAMGLKGEDAEVAMPMKGMRGQPGPMGPMGDVGNPGNDGPIGEQGVPGVVGEPGFQACLNIFSFFQIIMKIAGSGGASRRRAANNQEELGQRNNYSVENGEEQGKQFDMFWRRFVKRLRLL